MSVVLKINTNEVVRHTNRLEKMRKYDLPLAIRGTLNKAALDVKTRTMPKIAADTFEKRTRGDFFKGNSKVELSKGSLDVRSMKSTVGFISSRLQYNNEAVRELEQQEHGGKIDHRTFVPMDTARQAGNPTPVRAMNRLKTIRGKVGGLNSIKSTRKTKGANMREKFIRTAWEVKVGGYFISHGYGKDMLRRVNSVKRVGRVTKVKTTPIHSVESGRSVRIKRATHFMKRASLETAESMGKFFIAEAERRFAKIK